MSPIGGAFTFGLTDTLAIQPEVLFVQKASNLELTGRPFEPLPLDANLRNSLNWDYIEALDIGLVIGAGFYGQLITVEGRYEEGLMDTGLAWLDDEPVRNRAFLMLFGVRRR